MRKTIFGMFLVLIMLAVTGCDWQVNYNLQEQIEFLPESGADQYVMCQALAKSIQEIDFQKYAKKKVYFNITGGTPFTQEVTRNLAAEKLHKVEAKILQRLTEEEKGKGLKEEPGDFELTISILTCGVHSYDGLIRKNIVGLTLLSFEETDKDGVTLNYPGKLQRYQYEHLILSTYFIIAVLALIVLGIIIFTKWLLPGKVS